MFFILTYNLSPSHCGVALCLSSFIFCAGVFLPHPWHRISDGQTHRPERRYVPIIYYFKWFSRRYDSCISSWKFNVLLSYPFYVLSFSPSFLLFFSFSLTRTMVTGNWKGIWKMAAVKQLEMWVDDIKHDYSFDEIKMMVKRSNMFFGCVWNTLNSMV